MDIVEMETAHPKQFKDSPLGRIPTNWEVTSLGKSFDELYRYPTYYGIEYVESGIPEVRGELIKADGTIEENSENFRYISRETADRFPRVHLEPGDFVMSVRGTMGKVAIVPERLRGAVITANLIRMKFGKSVVVPEWARHFLCSEFFQDALDLATSVTTIRTIQVPELCAIAFRRPPINEQCRIAEILDTIDEAIQETEALISKLNAMKQGLLHDLLTCGLDENAKLRDPKAHPEQFKDSPFGLIPKTWQVKTAGELLGNSILEDIQDGNHGEMHPKTGDFVSEGVPFLMAKDLSNGKCDFRDCYRITKEQYRSLRIGFATCEDVLLSHKGTIGLTAIVPTNQPEVMLSPQVTYYRIAKRELLLPHYLRYWFISTWFQRQLSIFSAQSTRSYIGITLQRILPVLLPPPEEQAGITACFESHDARIRTEEQYRDKLKLQKKGLMHDLLTGKVRVKV